MRRPASVLLLLLALLTACGGAPSSAFNAAGYYVRGDTVYYLQAFPGKAFAIEDADPRSFKVVDATYATDRHAVYLDGAPLAGADPASFELLDAPGFSKDSGHVFLRDRVLTEDVAGFAFLDGGLSKDGAHVYWSDGSVLSEDPDHFVVLSDTDHYLFAKDASTVSVNGNPVQGADPATFAVLRGAYGRDAGHVYFFTDTVRGVDLGSFRTLEAPYARDRAHAYWRGKQVRGADPATFVVLNAAFECTADATHAFYRDLPVSGFDPGSIPDGATVTGCSETALSYS